MRALIGGLPCGIGVGAEVGVGVAAVAGDFFAEPIGAGVGGGFVGKFQFGEDERGVAAEKFVDFKAMSLVFNDVAVFFYFERAEGGEHLLGFGKGDGVFVFAAGGVADVAFDGEPCVIADDAHADAAFFGNGEIALVEALRGGGVLSPCVVGEQEAAFDF